MAALVNKAMRQRHKSFKEVVNEAIREALAGQPQAPFRTRSFSMGTPAVDLDRALQLAAALEDEEAARKTRLGK